MARYNSRKISIAELIDVDFEIDFDDYKDEFFANCTDSEIIDEFLIRKLNKYPSFNTNDDIIKKEDLNEIVLNPEKFKNFLCDILGLQYFTSNENIIKEIKEKLC